MAKERPKKTAGKADKSKKTADRVPTAKELAAFMGVPLRPRLKLDQSRRLLKPLPGYRAVMDNVAELLREDNELLELSYEPDEILAHLARAKSLSARAGVLDEVLAGSEAERQVEDSWLMDVLNKAIRRVAEESSTHPELKPRWAEIIDFVRKNRPGRTKTSLPDSPPEKP